MTAAQKNNASSELPPDYEPCGTCSLDHAYDFPLAGREEQKKAVQVHIEAGDRDMIPLDILRRLGFLDD